MNTDPILIFENEKNQRIDFLNQDKDFKLQSKIWLEHSIKKQYVYNYCWMGRPIIQNPVDIIAMQEIIWIIKPDLIIETGIAHGGSLIFSSAMLELNAMCGGPQNAEVIGIDIDIRQHNRTAIESHPMFKRIFMIEGSSIDPYIIDQVKQRAKNKKCILVCLDSNHTQEHVQAELDAYATLVTIGSYCVVFDTFVEDMPKDIFSDRPWNPGNSPKTAVINYLKTHPEFEIDKKINSKLLITSAPDGYLKRVS
jgi:cephalosporin hydroxylase